MTGRSWRARRIVHNDVALAARALDDLDSPKPFAVDPLSTLGLAIKYGKRYRVLDDGTESGEVIVIGCLFSQEQKPSWFTLSALAGVSA